MPTGVRQWVFTLHVQSDADIPDLWDPEEMKYLIYQLEAAPSTGQLHLQGAVSMKAQCSMKKMKSLLGAQVHLEPCGNWKKAVAYCRKEETRVKGPWEHGKDGGQGQRSDLEALATAVKRGRTTSEIADEYPLEYMKYSKGVLALQQALLPAIAIERRCALFWGRTGTGKTRMAHDNYPNLYKVMDIKTPWFEGYEGQSTVLIDECGSDMMNINILKRLTDRYKDRVPVKGGSVAWRAEVVILTSNTPMEHWYPNAAPDDLAALKRRIRVFHFPEEKWLAEAWIKGTMEPEPVVEDLQRQDAVRVGGTWGDPIELSEED